MRARKQAWLKDLKFGQKFHRQIEKMAIVGDKAWEKLTVAILSQTILCT